MGAAISLAVHALVGPVMASMDAPTRRPAPEASFVVLETPPPKPPPPEPSPSPEAPPTKAPVERSAPPTPAAVSKPTNAPPPAGGELLDTSEGVALDLTGITLGGGQSARLGAPGVASHPPSSAPTGRSRPPAPKRSAGRVVPVSDLSAPPTPPALGAALIALYPDDLRKTGVSGSAVVRALVGPDGRVRDVALASASHPGFGGACRQLIRGSQWSSPRDREGRAVSTWVRYRCGFVIDR